MKHVPIPTPDGLEQRYAPWLTSPFCTFWLWFRHGWRHRDECRPVFTVRREKFNVEPECDWPTTAVAQSPAPAPPPPQPEPPPPVAGFDFSRAPKIDPIEGYRLVSTVQLGPGAELRLSFFGYARGERVPGSWQYASDWHTNMQVAQHLPVPRVFLVQSLELCGFDKDKQLLAPDELEKLLPGTATVRFWLGIKEWFRAPAYHLVRRPWTLGSHPVLIPSMQNFGVDLDSGDRLEWPELWLQCVLTGTYGREIY